MPWCSPARGSAGIPPLPRRTEAVRQMIQSGKRPLRTATPAAHCRCAEAIAHPCQNVERIDGRAVSRVSVECAYMGFVMKDAAPAAVILYDGECGLCDRLVQWVLPRDRDGRFRFAPLQSQWAQAALRRHALPTSDFDSMVLIEGERIYLRSTAALRVLRGLPGWRWSYGFILLPRSLRDAVYGWIARRRKRWFPAPDACGLPKPGWRERFIE